MATNPFKQTPAIPSTTQSSNTQHYYDEAPTPVLTSTTSGATTSTSGSGTSAADSTNILKQRAPCACSNISIMQLFHEMKQKYPTVPDTVVSELVTQNCHDRPACIGKLEEAVLGTPGQTTYPSQSIHSGSLKRRSGERKPVGNRSDGSNSYSSNSSSNSSRESSVDSSRLQGTACPSTQQQQQAVSTASNIGYSDSRLIGESRTCANRPTTLAVRPATTGMGYFGATPPPAPPMRPNRTAPPCPPSNGPLATSSITATTMTSGSAEFGETMNVQVNVTVSPKAGGPLIAGQRHTSTISLQPEPPYTRELAQVSSTFSGGNQLVMGVPPTTSAGTPGGSSRTGSSGGMGTGTNGNGVRSSTSVNLTLRQPTDGGPRTPIHIHASPLKYTAKNFNAQSGIQSKLEVTFRDGCGTFRAMRAQVPGYEPQQELTTSHYQEREPCAVALPEGHSGWYQAPSAASRSPYVYSGFPPPLSSSSPLPHLAAHQMVPNRGINGQPLFADGQLENDGLTKEIRYQNFVVAEMAVSQQLEQKQRLSLEVERKRTQFESICREIFVLQQPLRFIDAELLDREVLVLAAEVEQLQKEVDSCDDEEARVQAAAAATAIGSSITDGLSALSVEGGSPLMLPPSMVSGTGGTVVNRPPRPPRPPPPRAPTQSPSRGSSGSITPNTPLLAPSLAGLGGTSPVPTLSSSSSSPCSTSSSFVSNGGGGVGDPMAASRLQPSATGPNQPWTCSLCTFQNHELMPACEVCSLPKASVVASGQDILIYLSPGQNKIIHSWIVS